MTRTLQRPEDPDLERLLIEVGKQAKAQRELMKLSQVTSAQLAGIPLGALRDLEQGYDTRISHHHLNAKHLGIPFGYGCSDDIAKNLKAIEMIMRVISDRIEGLSERVDRLGAALSDRQ